MGKPKNTKSLKGEAAGPGTVGKAKKKLATPEGDKTAVKRKPPHFKQVTLFKRSVKKAQKYSDQQLPFQKGPVLKLLRKYMDEASSGDSAFRMTGSARTAVLEATRGVIYDVMYGANVMTVVVRGRQTMAIRDIMAYLTAHPDYSKLISINKKLYYQAHITGASSLTSVRKSYINFGDSGSSTQGKTMKTREGKKGKTSKTSKKTEAKKAGGRKGKKDQEEKEVETPAPVDADATLDTSSNVMQVEEKKAENDDAASVGEEPPAAMELD